MYNIEKIYEEYATAVYKYLFCLTSDKELSEDLTQETFYYATRGINNFKGKCKLSVWLCQIAKHLLYKHLRKEKISGISLEEIEKTYKENTDIEKYIINKIAVEKLFEQINNLADTEKQVIILRIKVDLSFRQIGDIFNKSENWARVTFYRSKQKLKEAEVYEEG